MGGLHSTFDQLDSVGPESVVNRLSQCKVSEVRSAYLKLEESGATGDEQTPNPSTVALGLPLPISTATTLVHILEDEATGSIDIRDCFNVLTFFCCGAAGYRVQLFYLVHGWRLGDEVPSHVTETALRRLLQGVHRVYKADPWIKTSGECHSFDNLGYLAAELVSEIEQLAQRTTFCYTDLETWLTASLSACGTDDAMQRVQPLDQDKVPPVENEPSKGVESYTWVKVASDENQPVPSGRSKHAIAVHAGYIYLYGGRDGHIGHKDLWRFEIASNRWERMTCRGDRPNLLQEHSMITYKDKLYVFGGEFSSSWSEGAPLWILDLPKSLWTKPVVPPDVAVPCGRRGHSAVITNHQMYVYGGFFDLKGSTSELWIYDLEHLMWHLAYRVSPFEEGPGSRHNHSAVVHNNAMWVYGGMSDLVPRSDLWQWHFKLRKWTKYKCKNGPPALAGHSACKVPGAMLLYGGESAGVMQSDIWKFTFSTLTWQKLTCDGLVPSARTHHRVVVLPSFVLQQAWLAAGNDRSLSVPLLKPSRRSAGLDANQRPRSSPAEPTQVRSTRSPFRNSVVPAGPPSRLVIFREGGDVDGGQRESKEQDRPVVVPSEEALSLVKQVRDKLDGFSSCLDRVDVIQCDNERSSTPTNNTADSFRPTGKQEELFVQDRAEVIRQNIKQMRKIKTLDSGSLSRLLSSASESSEDWGYDNAVSLESSGHFTRLNSLDEEGGPVKRHKSYSILEGQDSDGFRAMIHKSTSVESILSMSHNPKLPPPSWMKYRGLSKLDLTKTSAFKSRSWDSLLRGFGGVGLTCVNIDTDPEAVEMTTLNSDVYIEDLEDCDLDQTDFSIPGSTQSFSSFQNLHSVAPPDHISISSRRAAAGIEIPRAWSDNSPDNQRTPTAATPDILLDVGKSIMSESFATYCEMSPERRDSQGHSVMQTEMYSGEGASMNRGDIELKDFSEKTSSDGPPAQAGDGVTPGDGLRKYLSQMAELKSFKLSKSKKRKKSVSSRKSTEHDGVRTCDIVHVFVFGGKESESSNIGSKPLPLWRLDVCEPTAAKYPTDTKRK